MLYPVSFISLRNPEWAWPKMVKVRSFGLWSYSLSVQPDDTVRVHDNTGTEAELAVRGKHASPGGQHGGLTNYRLISPYWRRNLVVVGENLASPSTTCTTCDQLVLSCLRHPTPHTS
jgi:hypothetical protein